MIIQKNFEKHAFKEGIKGLLSQHFADSIVNRFSYVLEAEIYNKNNKNILKQLQDEKYVCEVYYTHKSGIVQYICDVFSDWSKTQTEIHLLRYIEDRVKRGEIGKDWIDSNGKISEDVKQGKQMTDTTGEGILA
jgi:hypothetical protein